MAAAWTGEMPMTRSHLHLGLALAYWFVLSVTTAVNPLFASSTSTEILPPLFDAVIVDDASRTRTLLESGADPNQQIEFGYTALHFAVRAHVGVPERQERRLRGEEWPGKESTTVLRLLLSHGANPNAFSAAWGTPLKVAVYQGLTDSVRVLLEYGADPDGGEIGWSPLMVAAYHCYPDIAVLLLRYGASQSYSDMPGRIALSLAERRNCDSIIKMLSRKNKRS